MAEIEPADQSNKGIAKRVCLVNLLRMRGRQETFIHSNEVTYRNKRSRKEEHGEK